MSEPERIEKDAPDNSAPANTSRDRHGVTYTAGGVPLRNLSILSEAETGGQRPIRALWSKLWEADPPALPLQLGPGAPWPKVRRFVPAFLTSALIQSAVVFFLLSVPFAALLSWLLGYPPRKAPSHPQEIVVEYRHLNLADYLPVIHPPGQGKAPGRGAKPGVRPRLGSTRFDPRVTIISNPPNPDNSRLTLKTENAPPALKLPNDLKIPDFISGGPAPIPAVAKSPTPAPAKVESATPAKPNPAPPPVPAQPKIPAPPMVPIVPHVAPLIAPPPPPPPQLALAMPLPNIPVPQLEVPAPPPPVKNPAPPVPQAAAAPPQAAAQETPQPATAASAAAPGNKSDAAAPGDKQQSGGGPKILALSVDPIPFKDLSSIPAGQHQGAFSIGPAGSILGSPGGVPGGSPDVGEGGPGPGGDKSVAVGNGKGPPGGGGPGGSSLATAPSVSVTGGGGATGNSAGTLPPLKPGDLVYPVKPETPKTHAPSMVVSSGSGGGGGLNIYGVLHSDKVYTVYFSMPGKNWILQYCVHESVPKVDAASRTVQITMQPPLIPPATIEQFDFHRLTERQDPANGMIILHGIIREDGVVSDLTVLQGVDPTLDAAASAAFARWKFKPALRAGTPTAIEILVGIP